MRSWGNEPTWGLGRVYRVVGSVRRRVLELGGRGSVYVLTRDCITRRVVRVTSFANSDCTLSIGTAATPRGAMVVINIEFVTRAIGVLSPRGGMVLTRPVTNYPVTRRVSGRLVYTIGGRCPSCGIITCVGAATSLGAMYSIYIASSSTIGVVGGVSTGGVLFVPSYGLKRCIDRRVPRGGFGLLRNNYPVRTSMDRDRTITTGRGRPNTPLLIRPRYMPSIIGRTSCINSASNVARCTGGDSGGRFVVNARVDVTRRLRCTYPSGGFCCLSGGLVYPGVGDSALVSICGTMQNMNNRRVILNSSAVAGTEIYVSRVVELNN